MELFKFTNGVWINCDFRTRYSTEIAQQSEAGKKYEKKNQQKLHDSRYFGKGNFSHKQHCCHQLTYVCIVDFRAFFEATHLTCSRVSRPSQWKWKVITRRERLVNLFFRLAHFNYFQISFHSSFQNTYSSHDAEKSKLRISSMLIEVLIPVREITARFSTLITAENNCIQEIWFAWGYFTLKWIPSRQGIYETSHTRHSTQSWGEVLCWQTGAESHNNESGI